MLERECPKKGKSIPAQERSGSHGIVMTSGGRRHRPRVRVRARVCNYGIIALARQTRNDICYTYTPYTFMQ
jgi:hypothetical protein